VPTPLREHAVDNATKFSSKVAVIKPLFIRHDAEKLLQGEAQSKTRCAVVPSLAKGKYFTRPSIEEMCLMSENELMSIEDFEVCHEDFGSIKWPGCTDVRGMDLDKIVTIVDGRVSVYADSSPPVDTGLNKKAVVSLRVKRHAVCDVQATRLTERIQHLTVKAGHTFISYDLDTWIFSVPNFETSQS
jgi:nuclear pore complex protein Nup98-Nup96